MAGSVGIKYPFGEWVDGDAGDITYRSGELSIDAPVLVWRVTIQPRLLAGHAEEIPSPVVDITFIIVTGTGIVAIHHPQVGSA